MTPTLEQCRGISCAGFHKRDDMVPARRVLRDRKARGWYCRRCAARVRALRDTRHKR